MIKETWDESMKESTGTNLCDRAEDLVTYLYGEATTEQALQFEAHIERCSSCRTELVAFSDVRGAVGGWRNQALGSFVLQDANAKSLHAFEPVGPISGGRSAIAALRQFFRLSPIWMRAATAAGAVLFCALAAIAVLYFAQAPRTVVIESPVNSGYSEDQVKALLADAQNKQKGLQASDIPVPPHESQEPGTNEGTEVQASVTGSVQGRRRSNLGRKRIPPRKRLLQQATEALASSDYLPFTAPGDEERLPSLTDLVDEDDD